MSVWPSKFVILKDSFTEGLPDRVIKSQMDIGPAKKRRRTVLASYTINFTCVVKINDMDEFREFYLDNDVGIIDFTHPRTGNVLKARFNSVPSPQVEETAYKVNVELEILP